MKGAIIVAGFVGLIVLIPSHIWMIPLAALLAFWIGDKIVGP